MKFLTHKKTANVGRRQPLLFSIDLAFRQGLTYNKKGIRLRFLSGCPVTGCGFSHIVMTIDGNEVTPLCR